MRAIENRLARLEAARLGAEPAGNSGLLEAAAEAWAAALRSLGADLERLAAEAEAKRAARLAKR
jgi:hypothetical protein